MVISDFFSIFAPDLSNKVMKRIVMALVCLMTMVIGINAQNWSLEAKQNAIRIVKCNLKAPSTFILTNAYGEKIPVAKMSATYMAERTEYDSVMHCRYASVVDSIEYIYSKETGVLLDSTKYESYKEIGIDSITYHKRVYPSCYRCDFYYEAQNSFGGMIQNRAVVYVTKNEIPSRFIDYDSRRVIVRKVSKRNVFKPVPVPSIKRIKTYIDETAFTYELSKEGVLNRLMKMVDRINSGK